MVSAGLTTSAHRICFAPAVTPHWPRRHSTNLRPTDRFIAMTSHPSLPLSGRVALVTGASRGVGRGVAVALAAAGATVFASGRSEASLAATAEAAAATGGPPLTPMVCDHADDAAVAALFADIAERAPGGRLDLLVNNAFAGAPTIARTVGQPFWEKRVEPKSDGEEPPGAFWDVINGVGLRSNYVAMVHATRAMLPARSGLIVNISSFGGQMSFFDGVYGVGKAANDRLVSELAANLESPVDTGITALTLYPGLVSTELISDALADVNTASFSGDSPLNAVSLRNSMWNAESPIFVGRVVAALAADPDRSAARRRNGRIIVAAEAAARYGVRDVHGERRYSVRSLRNLIFQAVPALRTSVLARFVPDLLLPWALVRAATSAAPRYGR